MEIKLKENSNLTIKNHSGTAICTIDEATGNVIGGGTKLYYHMLRYPDDGQGGGSWLLSWISNISSFDSLYSITMIDETEDVVSMNIVLRDYMYEYQVYVLRVAYPIEGIDGSNIPFSFPSDSISTLVNQHGCTYNVYPL